jgi:tRNA-Thr(GGU) m(6)t(6)A37 methyltransferase TsaA
MPTRPTYDLRPIGWVASTLTDRRDAPRQPDEDAPPATLIFESHVADALRGIRPGDEILVLTWLHQGRRDVLRVTPRGDPRRTDTGVFATRSPDRPNPIGLHQVVVESIDWVSVRVRAMEAIDGTPIIDVKPLLEPDVGKR